jgi:ACR3 family arsenite transporter
MMMEDVLDKVLCEEVGRVVQDQRLPSLALVLEWGLGPLLMVTLAWPLLPAIGYIA